jgi:hypothetical protein
MTPIKAIVEHGRLEVDWPDGTEVEIHPLGALAYDANETMAPPEIARVLSAMDQVEPLDLSDTERTAWDSERQACKEWEKEQFRKRAVRLGEMWE